MKEKVPLPNTKPQETVKQTAAKHTHPEEAFTKACLTSLTLEPSPRRPGRGMAPWWSHSLRQPEGPLVGLSELEGPSPGSFCTREGPSPFARGFPPRVSQGAFLRTGRPLCTRLSATSGCGESPAHHSPLANSDNKRTSFQHTLVLHQWTPLWARIPSSRVWFCALAQSLNPGDPGPSAPFLGVVKQPQSVTKESHAGSFLLFLIGEGPGRIELAAWSFFPRAVGPWRSPPTHYLSLDHPHSSLGQRLASIVTHHLFS
jgi:hypothetical protein